MDGICELFFEKAQLSTNQRETFDDALSLDQSFARFVDFDPKKIQVKDLKSLLKKYFGDYRHQLDVLYKELKIFQESERLKLIQNVLSQLNLRSFSKVLVFQK